MTTDKPEKSLLKFKNKRSGRNNTGRITCRHKGGGSRKAYRLVDFKRNKHDIPAIVKTVEYDPNRNVRISLVDYADGEKDIFFLQTASNSEMLLQADQQVISESECTTVREYTSWYYSS